MKKLKDTNYLATEAISGSLLFGKEVNEKIQEEYETKNLNECLQPKQNDV